MWKFISAFCTLLIILTACKNSVKKNQFIYHTGGYWHQLISFNDDFQNREADKLIYSVTASFKNQADSVFWDSYNNLNDNYFIEKNLASSSNYLIKFISTLFEEDSCLLLINTTAFFKQQFNSDQIPFFSKNDTVVKINLKVKRIYSREEFKNLGQNLALKETSQIENYFMSAQQYEKSKDSLGFFWIKKPPASILPFIKSGDLISITYSGSFLNGRVIDSSPPNFKITYGTPDQILKGLNYVISRLKLGQNAKIILPSRLAFGEKGSSNFLIPPYTPLVYTIRINE